MTLTEEQINKIKAIAEKQTADSREDFNPMDDSGGNFDDAYYMGTEDGEIYMARTVLDMLGIDYDIED
jgi:hypothetical protein